MSNLWKRIKNFLKRFYPLTIRHFDQKSEKLQKEQQETIRRFDKKIEEQTRKLQEEIISHFDEAIEKEKKEIKKLQKKVQQVEAGIMRCIPNAAMSLEYSLVEHCNLNCAGCAHFSPLAEAEFADFEESARDFARLASLFQGRIKQIRLMGGEPLLHPDLIKFLKMTRENFPDTVITIVTNGLLLLNQPEEFWLACKENNIVIRPTKYPVPLNFEDMEKRAADYGVEYHYYNNENVVKTMNLYPLDLKGQQNCTKNFLHCFQANSCVTLWHGRLYTCPVAPTARHFSRYFKVDLKEFPEDSIDIYKVGSAQEIQAFLARPIPFCRYCMIDKTKRSLPWRQSERVMEEWT